MDKISTLTSLIEGIVSVYDEKPFQKTLLKHKDDLCAIFEVLLSDYAHKDRKYNLISSNTVRELKYFSVIGRVKEKESFHEKLLRGNLIYPILEIQTFKTKSEILLGKQKVQNAIKQVSDDIIGIKILTEVDEDCKSVLKLLVDIYDTELNDKSKLFLSRDDIDSQPVKMRNGLDIYKIRGIYLKNFQFELQIKSKLLSVWGDMDHSLFYKDYSVSPVKDNVKNSMIHLGTLIKEVDRFLLQIREANKTFSENRKVIEFAEQFSAQYSELFKQKFGFGYRLEEITDFLFYLYSSRSKTSQIHANIDFSILSLKNSNPILSHYIKLRNNNLHLQIVELIFFNWFSRTYKKREQKKKNFETKCFYLLKLYQEFIIRNLKKEIEIEAYAEFINANFTKILLNLTAGDILFTVGKMNNFLKLLKLIDAYADFDVRFNQDQISTIQIYLLLVFLKQNACDFLNSESNVDLDKLKISLSYIRLPYESSKLHDIKNFKEAQELIQNSLRQLMNN